MTLHYLETTYLLAELLLLFLEREVFVLVAVGLDCYRLLVTKSSHGVLLLRRE
jgi:hypothetical protein